MIFISARYNGLTSTTWAYIQDILMKTIGTFSLTDNEASKLFLCFERFMDNVVRTFEMQNSALNIINADENEENRFNFDILRSGIVLFHASMEDVLREIGRVLLIKSHRFDNILIRLPGEEVSKETIGLKHLVRYHKDLTVGDLVSQIIGDHLDSMSFTSAKRIYGYLQSLGVDASSVELPKNLDTLINRRHDIVHRADRNCSGALNSMTGNEFISLVRIELQMSVAVCRLFTLWGFSGQKVRSGVKKIENEMKKLK